MGKTGSKDRPTGNGRISQSMLVGYAKFQLRIGEPHERIRVYREFKRTGHDDAVQLDDAYLKIAAHESRNGNPAITAIMLDGLRTSAIKLSYKLMEDGGVAGPFVEAVQNRIGRGDLGYAVMALNRLGLKEVSDRLAGDLILGLKTWAKTGLKNEAMELAEIIGIEWKEIESSKGRAVKTRK